MRRHVAACSARGAAADDARRHCDNPTADGPYAAFDQRLRELGYVEGQNLALDYIDPEHQAGGNAGVIEELLRRKVDIILAPYESTLKAALAASAPVPIVMVAVDYDPLALGYVKSLARPGGKATGLNLQQFDLAKKRVELLTQALPSVQVATVFWDTDRRTMEGDKQRRSGSWIAAR